ncbi:MAG: SurA N-terminal domain-containing protein, partial [Candidatus Marivariicella sp.]
MALLGQIRERSIFLIIVIGMALFAFVISGVFTSDGGGGSISEPIAKVNDVEIDLDLFRFNVEQTERNYNFSTLKSVDAVWNQTIRNAVLENQYKILGIDAGTAQLEEIISSNDAFLNDQRFLNESGFFDFGLFTNFIISMKTNNPEGYENWKAQESQLISMAKQNIYLGLVRSSATFSDFEGKFAYHTENDNVSIEYVQIPYSLISDSMVSVSDNEIKKYITQNPDKFKRNETRSIDYVLFDETPTEEDILEQRNSLEKLIGNRIEYNDVSKLTDTILGFKNTNDISGFVSQHSNIPFDSIYKSKGELVSEYSEILFNLNENKIFGPYIEGKNIKISKMIDQKKDGSIRASHILISYKE